MPVNASLRIKSAPSSRVRGTQAVERASLARPW